MLDLFPNRISRLKREKRSFFSVLSGVSLMVVLFDTG